MAKPIESNKTFVYLSGKVRWYQPRVANKWNKWDHVLYPDAESLEILRDLQAQGLKNVIKKDEDGYFLRISRPVTKHTHTGKVLTFKQPGTFDADGAPFDGNVGNDSDVTTKVEVYKYITPGTKSGGIAMQWVSTRIDNLVPFNPNSDLLPHQKEEIEGLMNQPPKEFF